MKMKQPRLLALSVLFLTSMLLAQPAHQRLWYSHPLTHGVSLSGETIINQAGAFDADRGWQAVDVTSQLQMHFAAPLPAEGTLRIRVSNFDPSQQFQPEIKQHIINLYSRLYDDNKDIFESDGAWCNIRTGSYYSAGQGMAGFKFLAAPRGIGTRKEANCIDDFIWFLGRFYEFKIVWTRTTIWVGMDNMWLAQLPFSGQIEPFKHLLLGKDNLIWGYAAQPGPWYFDLRIYEAGEPLQDHIPPDLMAVTMLSDSTLQADFSEPLDQEAALQVSRYRIEPAVAIRGSALSGDGRRVTVHTAPHPRSGCYTLWVENLPDRAVPANNLASDSVSYYYEKSPFGNISRSHYRIHRKGTGDLVYSDRAYTLTQIPEVLQNLHWLETANDDKQNSTNDFLSFHSEAPVRVYIAYDAGIVARPAWLSGWQATALRIESTDSDYLCYRHDFPPGLITLGGNAGGSSSSMYLIVLAVQEAPEDTTAPASPRNVRVRMVYK